MLNWRLNTEHALKAIFAVNSSKERQLDRLWCIKNTWSDKSDAYSTKGIINTVPWFPANPQYDKDVPWMSSRCTRAAWGRTFISEEIFNFLLALQFLRTSHCFVLITSVSKIYEKSSAFLSANKFYFIMTQIQLCYRLYIWISLCWSERIIKITFWGDLPGPEYSHSCRRRNGTTSCKNTIKSYKEKL